MTILIDGLMLELQAWVEWCPCHRHVMSVCKGKHSVHTLRQECGEHLEVGDDLKCPARSCQSPFLCSGEFWGFIEQGFKGIFGQLVWVRSRLAAEQWSLLLQGMDGCKSYVAPVLAVKFSNWSELFWGLRILAYPDVFVARKDALRIVDMYQRFAHEAAHHHLTTLLLTEQLGNEVRTFSTGTPIRRLPLLTKWKNRFNFIPCAEREIEWPHSWITRKTLSVVLVVRGLDLGKCCENE